MRGSLVRLGSLGKGGLARPQLPKGAAPCSAARLSNRFSARVPLPAAAAAAASRHDAVTAHLPSSTSFTHLHPPPRPACAPHDPRRLQTSLLPPPWLLPTMMHRQSARAAAVLLCRGSPADGAPPSANALRVVTPPLAPFTLLSIFNERGGPRGGANKRRKRLRGGAND